MSVNQAAEEFHLTLLGAGVEIKRIISPQKAALVMNVIMGVEPVDAEHLHRGLGSMNVEAPVRLSLREYLDSVKATKKPDQIVAIAHYLAIHEEQATFLREHIKDRFVTAREPMPANFPRDFGSALKAGMIAEDHKKQGHYYVTKTGIHAIERQFRSSDKN